LHFSLDELRSLCADLDVDFDELRGETKTTKADALLERLDHRGGIPQLIAKLMQLRPNVDWREIDRTANAEPPFKGLLYFDVADAPLFFGREQLTAQLIARLLRSPADVGTTRFLAVIGASGSGKSSLVRAGVVATLWRNSQQHGITPQHTFILTPTERPLRELAAKLTRDDESTRATTTFMDDLRTDPRSLDVFIAKLPLAAGQKILIVVDQFEELFTACKDEAERKAFIGNLLEAASGAHNGPVLVLLTLRADFYEKCAPYADLRTLLEQRQAFIGPMSEAELRAAIQQPTQQVELSFEPGLVELLLREVGAEPGALPLLSHALLETWHNRRGRVLSLQGYTDSGGVHGAIAKTADATLAAFESAERAIAKRIFLALTELGEGTQDMCRRAMLSDLIRTPEETPSVEAVLQTLANARLITTDQIAAEVSHEALIREWGQLRSWLDEDRAGLRLQRQLEADAREWLRLNRDPDLLYRGAKLAQAQELMAHHPDYLGELAREYLGVALAEAQRSLDEREVQRQRALMLERTLMQADVERARVRQARLATLGASILTILALVASVFAFRARGQADQANLGLAVERKLAEANAATAQMASTVAVSERNRAIQQAIIIKSLELAAQAVANQAQTLDLSFLLSVEAWHTFPTFETKSALLDTLLYSPYLSQYSRAHVSGVNSVTFSPDGMTLASGGNDHSIILWDVSNWAEPKVLGPPLTVLTGTVTSIAFSPDSKTLSRSPKVLYGDEMRAARALRVTSD
jgi:Effector-associated domain 7/AAA ATPase domain/WD domain, G-beta repeat